MSALTHNITTTKGNLMHEMEKLAELVQRQAFEAGLEQGKRLERERIIALLEAEDNASADYAIAVITIAEEKK